MTKFLKTYKLKWTSIFFNLKSLPALFSPQHIWNMYAPGVLGTLFSEAHSFGDDFQLNYYFNYCYLNYSIEITKHNSCMSCSCSDTDGINFAGSMLVWPS